MIKKYIINSLFYSLMVVFILGRSICYSDTFIGSSEYVSFAVSSSKGKFRIGYASGDMGQFGYQTQDTPNTASEILALKYSVERDSYPIIHRLDIGWGMILCGLLIFILVMVNSENRAVERVTNIK